MTLTELLDELRTNVLRDVSTAVVPQAGDSLWSDAQLIRYLSDAEDRFARETLCLRDSITTAVARITLVADQADYPLDTRVISCNTAIYDGTLMLGRSSYGSRFGARGDITPNVARSIPQESGIPQLYYTDKDSAAIGFYPAPAAEQAGKVIALHVVRRPLAPLTSANMAAEPEIPEEFHLDLVEWGAWRALRNHDADIDGNPDNIAIVMARASAHKKRFEEAVAECKRKFKYLNTQHVEFGVNANWS